MIAHDNSLKATQKRKRLHLHWLLVACLMALLIAVAMSAHWVAADQEPDIAAGMEGAAPLRSLLARVSEAYPGRVLEVELEREESGKEDIWVYEIKLLTARGSVLKLEYDAVSLELLELEGKADN